MIIRIARLRLRVSVGVTDSEREHPQEVVLNVQLDVSAAGAVSDQLADTVDYRALAQALAQRLEAEPCQLLEALGSRALSVIMSDPRVRIATVELFKSRSIRFADSVSVIVEARRRPDSGEWDVV